MRYRGRFAPSPTGPLHAGSLVAALGSWLDARARDGSWLIRVEDVDTPRCVPGADRLLLGQLAALGLTADEDPSWQSSRTAGYAAALAALREQGASYPCLCSRRDIDEALATAGRLHQRDAERVYPGTCRAQLAGPGNGEGAARRSGAGAPAQAQEGRAGQAVQAGRAIQAEQAGQAGHAERGRSGAGAEPATGPPARRPASVRFRLPDEAVVDWSDRRLGAQLQDVAHEVGDFVLRRADGLWSYQLAVVVDDAAQGISDVVRGEDLADNTARQILLQRALGLATPTYLHLPLVRAADGRKLSKQNGAAALDLRDPVAALRAAAAVLGLPEIAAASPAEWLAAAVQAWPWRADPGRPPAMA